jgi:hypothetical protein
MTELKEWLDIGSALAEQHSTQKWALADWLAAGDTAWGGIAYDHAMSLFPDLSRKYLTQLAYTARNVTSTVRQYKLSFAHHELVASLEPADQDRLLTRAIKDGWTCGELRRQLKEVELPGTCSVAIQADLFRKVDEFSRMVNVSPAALVMTAITYFLQAPPLDLKEQYEASVLAQRERAKQRDFDSLVEMHMREDRQKVAQERALFIRDSSIAVMNIDERTMSKEAFDAKQRLRSLINDVELHPIAELQAQLDKLLALCKPPEPATDTKKELVATSV